MSDEVLPSWMSDGKGLQGDALPVPRKRLEFPTAQVSRVDGGGGMTDEVGRQVTSPDGGFIGYPWEKQSIDKGDDGAIQDYDIWCGSGISSFATADTNAPVAIPIKALEIEVCDPDDPTASAISLIIGDNSNAGGDGSDGDGSDGDGGIDMMQFTYGGNVLRMNWTTQSEIFMADDWAPGQTSTGDDSGDGNSIDIFLDENNNSGAPTVLLTDSDGQTVQLDIISGPEILLQDDSGNEIKIDINNDPEIEITDDSDNGLLITVAEYPKILLSDVYDDPDSGNSVTIDLQTGPEIVLKDDGGNSINLDINNGPELVLNDNYNNSISVDINNGPEIVLDDGDNNTITIDINGEPEIVIAQYDGSGATLSAGELDLNDADGNTTTLTSGDLELTDSDSGGSVSLTSGDLELSNGSSSVSVNCGDLGGDSASFQSTSYFDGDGILNTAYILRSSEDSDDDGSAFAQLVTNVLEGLSWIITCNSDGTFTVTIDDGN